MDLENQTRFNDYFKGSPELKGKAVINTSYGGFGISEECRKLTEQYGGKDIFDEYDNIDIDLQIRYVRTHPALIRAVEELGSKRAGTRGSKLTIVEVYRDFKIDYYDGYESIE